MLLFLNNFAYFADDSIRCVLLGNCLDWTAGGGEGEVLYNLGVGVRSSVV